MPVKLVAGGVARRLARGLARRQGMKDMMFWVVENIPGVLLIPLLIRLLMVTVVIIPS